MSQMQASAESSQVQSNPMKGQEEFVNPYQDPARKALLEKMLRHQPHMSQKERKMRVVPSMTSLFEAHVQSSFD